MIEAKSSGEKFQVLTDIMARLRGPDGCPWDREQDVRSLTDFFLEEVYEAVDALQGDDPRAVAEELGDVLMEVVLLARIFEERGDFTIADALEDINSKMIRRHPHVFGEDRLATSLEVLAAWNQRKKSEKNRASHFEGIPTTAPALQAAFEIGKKAAQFGFDWPSPAGALDKVREEIAELEAASAEGRTEKIAEELGDCLFALACASRLLHVHPETALRRANAKFIKRFSALEDRLRQAGRPLEGSTLEEMEEVWQAVKRSES
jgi:MazG family protein